MAKKKSEPLSAREHILSAIRRGLDAGAVPKPFPEVADVPIRSVYNPPAHSLEESFAEAFIALGGKFLYCASEPELFEALHALIDDRNWTETLCADPTLLTKLHRGGLSFIRPAAGGTEGADACITGCDYLVARTGSVILSSAQPGGRIAPVYYPVHIIVARPGQLVEDLGDGLTALLLKSGENLPSLINLNTGPSRTADIEKTLVVGVHGPKEVFVFFLDR
jgi:L-lactate dehydrogenase complex protein LldG